MLIFSGEQYQSRARNEILREFIDDASHQPYVERVHVRKHVSHMLQSR